MDLEHKGFTSSKDHSFPSLVINVPVNHAEDQNQKVVSRGATSQVNEEVERPVIVVFCFAVAHHERTVVTNYVHKETLVSN